ncbi:MAG: helix-turn-helix transcriptional regulator [Clostridia bacterium]|jgi:transcriptional regulator with XRE-family HTH domain|nr:helix-turn-helix transcriptional regulator [Clostridia bacterium]
MTSKEIKEKESIKIFSKELKKLLNQANLKQSEFAREISVDKNSVYMWVSGKTQPKLYQLKLIIEYFISCDKTKDFNPLQLFVPNAVLYNTKSTAYQKAIHRIQEMYDSKLKQEVKNSTNAIKIELELLQDRYEDRLDKNKELSSRNSYLESVLKDKDYYKKKLSDLNKREKTYKKEVREILVKNLVLKNIYPESTAKQVLRNSELQAFIKKMYKCEKENGLTDSYREYYQELIEKIINTLEDELIRIIKEIYNPDDLEE